jgi:hypothetical protein
MPANAGIQVCFMQVQKNRLDSDFAGMTDRGFLAEAL